MIVAEADSKVARMQAIIQGHNDSVTTILGEIERLNHTITDLHARKRELEARAAVDHEYVRSCQAEVIQIKAEQDRNVARGGVLQERVEKLEKLLPSAQERLRRHAKHQERADKEDENVIKVVHVGLDGAPWKAKPIDEKFVLGKPGDPVKRYVRVSKKD